MTIISISISEDVVSELDNIRTKLGAGRSEVVRAGIKSLSQEEQQRQKLQGQKSAVLVVTHLNEYDTLASEIMHSFEDMIRTHTHNKIDEKRCVEIFVLDGMGDGIRNITDEFVKNKKMDSVKLMVL